MPGCRRNVTACRARTQSVRRAPTASGRGRFRRWRAGSCDGVRCRQGPQQAHRQAVDRRAMFRTGCPRRVRSRPPTRFAVHDRHQVHRGDGRTAWHRRAGAVRADRLRAPCPIGMPPIGICRARRTPLQERKPHRYKHGRRSPGPGRAAVRRCRRVDRTCEARRASGPVEPAGRLRREPLPRCGQRARRSGCARAG